MRQYRIVIERKGTWVADAEIEDLNDVTTILEYEADRLNVGLQTLTVRIVRW